MQLACILLISSIMMFPRLSAQPYRASIVVLLSGNALDTASSWGKLEMNPVLGRQTFGWQQTVIKLGIVGAVLGIQRVVLKRDPKLKKAFTIVNFAAGAAMGSIAARNWYVASDGTHRAWVSRAIAAGESSITARGSPGR